jgi:predicted nuclease with TOPRIM domain
MNGTYAFVLTIIAMSLAAGIINNFLRAKRLNVKKGELDEVNDRMERIERQISALGERVNTVETIVTDKNFDLRQEIEGL